MTQPPSIAVIRAMVEAGGQRPMTLTTESAEKIIAYIDDLEAKHKRQYDRIIALENGLEEE